MAEQSGPLGKTQLHLRVGPDVVALLDAKRGPATRNAYAAMVLERDLKRGEPEWERPRPEKPQAESEERRIEAEFTAAVKSQPVPQDPPKRPRKPPKVTTAAELVKPPEEREATAADLAARTGLLAPSPARQGAYPCCKHCKRGHGGHGDPCLNGCHG